MDNIRLTPATAKVLKELLDDIQTRHYGREIMQATGLKSGSLYPILARLERQGVIKSEKEEIDASEMGRPARRYYKVTGEGARAARLALAELHEITRVTEKGPGLRPGLTT
ncbi:helix-turn-helix transcriptional regulator [Streptomyces sp. H10-C2]|uniref:PadR family transcriptional regulator n=1 Tax=unclassified Streptomyces TaxID=2593676 RepID=UPI0024BA92A8|nr:MULTISPECIES: helix-turn-helix transcriptional regulator [unclassified Streptomyces]MDJ0343345.1 helix-turn-helix transcriptional regulator [Streptomyces sp. PH10-H1]MDJ0372870.1 helix-turn-helix transcriptional regulator [Streptomyces sp. H10-C2]